jgi:serine protease
MVVPLLALAGCLGGGGSGGGGGPEADFTVSPSSGLAPLTVTLDAAPSSADVGELTGFRWQLPDGRTAEGETVSVELDAGASEIGLTVTDSTGATDSRTRTVSFASLVALAGTATTPEFLVLDGDINNPEEAVVANDTAGQAQSLPNPALVGGFLTRSATGRLGDAFAATPDRRDVYRIQLAAKQVVTLQIGDFDADSPAAVDLDLGLYATDDTDFSSPVADSSGLTATESLRVPQSGTYLLVVEAVSGASNYNLTVGSTATAGTATTERLSLSGDYVPGEVVARCEAGAATAATAANRLAGLSVAARAGGGGGGPSLLAVRSSGGAELGLLGGAVTGPGGSEQRARRATVAMVKALRARPDCRYAAPNYRRRALVTPDDSLYDQQWAMTQLRLPQAWEIDTGSAGGPVVAVVDSGRVAHPDLAGRFTGDGYDFIADPALADDGDGIDPDPTDPGDARLAGGSFHGTHVAGTVAAAGDNGAGVAGVLWDGRMMAVRVLGPDGGTSYDLMQGLRYAAGLSNDSGTTPAEPAAVINLSLGGGSFSQAEADLFQILRERGILVTAAAGNQGVETVVYPAGYEGVVGVGAVDRSGDRAPYSNTGAHVDLAAPGGNLSEDADGDGQGDGILSTWADDSGDSRQYVYAYLQGTSMATPHAAGIMALMKGRYPGLTPGDFDSLLAAGELTRDLGPAGYDREYGHGLIDALDSLKAANDLAGGAPLPPVLAPDPSQLAFGYDTAELTLTLSNAGDQALTVDSVTAPASWLTATATSGVGSEGLGDYRISVDRSGLSAGPYAAAVEIADSTGRLTEVAVSMSVLDSGGAPAGRVGKRYVVVVESSTGAPVATALVAPESGSYPFSLQAGQGSFHLVAGTDMDNDGYICDAGEACGAYPTLAEAQPLVLEGGATDRSGMDFNVGFRWNLTGTGVAAAAVGEPDDRPIRTLR